MQTREDTADLTTWQAAGLHLDAAGYILPSNRTDEQHQPMADDMIANSLVWLVMQVVNLVAAGNRLSADRRGPSGRVGKEEPSLEYWENLIEQIDVWYNGLPARFQPTSTVWPEEDKTGANLPSQWYAGALHASTIQWYHFARIEMLHNKPQHSQNQRQSSLMTKLSPVTSPLLPEEQQPSYADVLQQSKYHAKEILSIGCALTDEGARVHSVQPLYAAGQVLGMQVDLDESSAQEHSALRACVIGLLGDIERDTGWATQYRATQLLNQWGRPEG